MVYYVSRVCAMKWFPDKWQTPEEKRWAQQREYLYEEGKTDPVETDQVSLSKYVTYVVNYIAGGDWLLLNPIFLKMFRMGDVKTWLGPERAFMYSFIGSLILNLFVLPFFYNIDRVGLTSGFMAFLLGNIILVAELRLLFICLIYTMYVPSGIQTN